MIKWVGRVAYMLKLPESLKFHPIFHVSFLKPYHEDLDEERVQTKRVLPLVMKQFDQEVKKILNHRTMEHSRKKSTNRFFGSVEGNFRSRSYMRKGCYLVTVLGGSLSILTN